MREDVSQKLRWQNEICQSMRLFRKSNIEKM